MKRLGLHAPGYLVVSFSLLAFAAACEEPPPDNGETLDSSAFLEHDALPGTDGWTDTPPAAPLTCADFDIGGPGTGGGSGSGGGGAGHSGGGGGGHGGSGGHGGGGGVDPVPLPADGIVQGEEIFRGYCASCHTIGRGDLRGPDLQHVYCRPSQWLRQWLTDPAAMRETNPWAQQLSELWDVHMPDPELSPEGIESVIAFMAESSAQGPLEPLPPVDLSPEAFDATADLYFNRCAGCHGTYRGGATGPDIGPERSIALGTDTLAATIRHGTPSGMPGLGEMDVVSDEEVAALAAFLQLEPPEAPQLSLDEIRDTWTLLVAPEDRPTEPAHSRDWEDFFGVILRDSGQTAIIDGDTREELVRIDSGFAGHILRSSLSGRYFYAIGRDGWLTMIDLWMDPPTAVAKARGCYDARSVEGSKLETVGEAYVVEGCYWPNQYVVFDGQTLEPIFRGDIQADAVDTGAALAEVRIAVIVASHYNPYWLLALKESGHVAVVDYSAPDFPIIAMLEADRFLHDGGWDHTGRYLIVAANARNRMVVVDAEAVEVVATIDTGVGPHPGRGANWEDPEFGWVNATTHMGEGRLLVYGADPEARPDVAWQVVRDVPLPTAGSLFLKTHPASPWLLIDFPVSQDVAQQRRMCAYSKAEGTIDRCWDVSDDDPIVHFEFNAEGTEVWVSIWGPDGEIAIYDAVNLEEIGRITGLPTPTGKFNVFNTANDIY